jgi:hypothetical protein
MDAGLRSADVNGLLVAPTMPGSPITMPAMVAEYLGLTPTYCNLVHLGGDSAAGMVYWAAAASPPGCVGTCLRFRRDAGPWAVRQAAWRGLPASEYETVNGRAGATSGYALVTYRYALCSV